MNKEEIKEIFSRRAYVEPEYIKDDMMINRDLMMDSLQFTAAIVEIERRFQVSLPISELELTSESTFGELYGRLESKLLTHE